MFSHRSHTHCIPRASCGFTLIELLVVIAVFTVLTSALLLIRPSSDKQTQLRNTAHEVVLFLRAAQAYGSGVRSSGAGAGGFQVNYGVQFRLTTAEPLVRLFSDDAQNPFNGWQDSSQTPLVDSLDITQARVAIERICMMRKDNGQQWCSSGGGPPLNRLNVLFKRPSLDAHLYGFTGAPSAGDGVVGTSGYVCLGHPQTTRKLRITILDTGQFQIVESANCN